ncbi:MFS transporter [Pseudonocardia xishanensis]|uniref:Major facilitator superfamily (MFS) profile domain-containing protein n=1 Tax=Pseudonocardia xishanensis TaxID=630995 RepID=A0ABP8RZ40_9PSEU
MPVFPAGARPHASGRSRPSLPPTFTRLRVAVTAVFAFAGAVFGSWAARIPDVTAQVGATHATLGVALLCVSLGALASMQLTGALAARFGSGRVLIGGVVGLCLVVPLPGLATSIPELSAALLLFGAFTGLVNVAVNSAGVAVEARRPDRPLLPFLHAAFSLGGLAGAAAGGIASALGPVLPHLVGVGVVGLAVALWTRPVLTTLGREPAESRPAPDEQPAAPLRDRGLIVLLGLIAGCTAFGEGAITDWGALHLQETLGAAPALAAAGYSCFSLAMACGRLVGGVLLRRWGRTRLLGGGALLAAAGMTPALLTSSAELALAGFVLVGLGLANLFPLAIAQAGTRSGARGVALASTVGYTGLLGGPPAIGFLADHAGLPTALAAVPVLALVAAVLSLVVAPTRPRITLPALIPLPGRAAGSTLARIPLPSRIPLPVLAPALRRIVTVPADLQQRPGRFGDTTRRVVLKPLRPVVRTGRPLMVDARVQPLRIIRTPGSRVAVPVRPSMLRGATLVERSTGEWVRAPHRERHARGASPILAPVPA